VPMGKISGFHKRASRQGPMQTKPFQQTGGSSPLINTQPTVGGGNTGMMRYLIGPNETREPLGRERKRPGRRDERKPKRKKSRGD